MSRATAAALLLCGAAAAQAQPPQWTLTGRVVAAGSTLKVSLTAPAGLK